MRNIDASAISRLQAHVQDCISALILDTAFFVRRGWFGRPKLTDRQRAWYLGFVGAWAERSITKERLDISYIDDFVSAVFDFFFEPVGLKDYQKAVRSIQSDGPIFDMAKLGERQFKEWGGGQFVPKPPSE